MGHDGLAASVFRPSFLPNSIVITNVEDSDHYKNKK